MGATQNGDSRYATAGWVGILTMLMLMLTVKDDEYIFSLTATREKISFFFMKNRIYRGRKSRNYIGQIYVLNG